MPNEWQSEEEETARELDHASGVGILPSKDYYNRALRAQPG